MRRKVFESTPRLGPRTVRSVALLVVLTIPACVHETTKSFPIGQRALPDAGDPLNDLGDRDALAGDAGALSDAGDGGLGAGDGVDAADLDGGEPDADIEVRGLDAGDVFQEADAADLGDLPDFDILRVVVVSDLNDSYGSTTYGDAVWDAVGRVIDLEPDLVLSTGDMVAGQRSGLDYRAMWRGFHEAVSDPLAEAGIPFAVSPGNHDASAYSSYTAERDIFVDEWAGRRPDVAFLDAADYPLRYSFTMGPALFISLDDTIVGPLSVGDLDWIEDQLDAGWAYPVKIVYGHVPLFPLAQGRESEVRRDFDLEEMLAEHGVTAFISGHHHAYYPGQRGSVRLVGTACLGAGRRQLIGETATSSRSILVLEITEAGIETLDAYEGASFDAVIERASLPESVGEAPMTVWRDDVASAGL